MKKLKSNGLLMSFILSIILSSCSTSFESLTEVKISKPAISKNVAETTINYAGFYDNIIIPTGTLNASAEGLEKLVFNVSVKNLENKAVKISDTVKLDVKYDNKYDYTDAKYFGFTNDGAVNPLETSTGYVYVEVPKEAMKNKDKLQCVISVGKTKYAYKDSLENYDEYFKAMNKSYDEYEKKTEANNEHMKKVLDDIQDVGLEIKLFNSYDANAKENLNNLESKLNTLNKERIECGNKDLSYKQALIDDWKKTSPPINLLTSHNSMISHLEITYKIYNDIYSGKSSDYNITYAKYEKDLNANLEKFWDNLYQINYVSK